MEKFKLHRWDTGAVIAEVEAETLREALEKLVANKADLAYAKLAEAKLAYAKLAGADLAGAKLAGAKLTFIKHDLWAVLLYAREEINGLIFALQEGRVDGSVYEGECACLVGTLANVRHCKHTKMQGITPDSSRPAEVWFMGISKGDLPENNQIVEITLNWIKEFQALISEKGA